MGWNLCRRFFFSSHRFTGWLFFRPFVSFVKFCFFAFSNGAPVGGFPFAVLVIDRANIFFFSFAGFLLMGFDWEIAADRFTGFGWVSLSFFIGLYWVVLGCTGFYRVLPSCGGVRSNLNGQDAPANGFRRVDRVAEPHAAPFQPVAHRRHQENGPTGTRKAEFFFSLFFFLHRVSPGLGDFFSFFYAHYVAFHIISSKTYLVLLGWTEFYWVIPSFI